MKYEEFISSLQNIGKDPSRLIFEDELTGIYNRRFLLNYFQYKVPWDALQENPLSLVMIDVDHFKQINDTYGHNVGDQALIWVAGLLKEVAKDENLAIRYAGDEFMILVVRGEKNVALGISEQLLRRVNEEPCRIGQEDRKEERLPITLSMGVASAPEDAQTGKSLIQKADTALYFAKKEGRNRLANAAKIAPEEVFARTALHQLEGEKIAGRRQQLALASEFLKKFGQGQSLFLIVEGAAGMGKSTFLETVRQNLAQNRKIWQAKVHGTPQESFRPYYLTTKILVELLDQRKDRGGGVFEKLNSKELAYLSHILPQLRSPEQTPLGEEPRAMREGIFHTLVHFIPKVIESSPLALFIDDLDIADEATLLLLRQLMRLQQFPLFICSSSTNPRQFQIAGQEVPLEVFYESYRQELDIRKINLTSLTAADITDHLRGVFPQVSIPASFEKTLEQVTRGNPLFLGEILRQLVLEQKIVLRGQQWVIEPLEIEGLPKSLEGIVSQKIAALDEKSRHLLQQASAFGEDVSLSLLTGSSEEKEAEVLEFIDQAVAQGLIRSEFHFNDETIHFLGKQIQEITDGAIQPDEKRKLHERIGSYQETLYEQNLLPSAAILAYHFKRSANQEKAKTYEQFQADYDKKIFSSAEVIQYVVERRSELPPPGTALDPESLALVPAVIRCLLTSLRSIKFYPPGSEAVITANRQVKEAIDPILEKNTSLTIFKVRQSLMINGQKVDVSDFKLVAEELLKILDRAELQGIVLHQGLAEQEVEVLLDAIGRIKPKMIDRDYWQRFTVEQQLIHVELKQVRYTITVEREGQAVREKPSPAVGLARPVRVPSRIFALEEKLEPEDLSQISDILRALLTAAKNIKLYPLYSKIITSSIDHLLEGLRRILKKRSVLTLAHVGDSLVINGVKMDTSGMETLVEGFQKLLDSLNLRSLTFLENLSPKELTAFIGALSQLPPAGLDREFWARFSEEQGLSNILFDQVLYETQVTSTLGVSEKEEVIGELLEEIVPISEEHFDSFLKTMPGQMSGLLMEGDEKKAHQMTRQLLHGFADRPTVTREKIVESCHRMMEDLTLALQHHFAQQLADPLLMALAEEKDAKILREIASLLHRMATNFLHFAEHVPASRIFSHLNRRYRQLEESNHPQAQRLAKILDRKLEPTIQKLLLDDLKSGETSRQQNATLLLGSLGRISIPLLVEVIKKTEDLKTRQLAANLLGELGSEAAELIKHELVLEGHTEERLRILEIIDTVTRDLKTELAYTLGDRDPTVRQAAFQLAERLNDSRAINLLLKYAKDRETSLAVVAIESLGKLKPTAAVEVLNSLLETSRDTERLMACCRALGQIADPASVEPLTKILSQRGFLFRRKKRRPEVRAAAIFALAQISHPQAVQSLALFVEDRDPRVREIARSRVNL